MKVNLLKLIIYILRGILNTIYAIFKILPIKEKNIVFCSRQSNEVPLDYRLIEEELDKKIPDIHYINICRQIGGGVGDYIKFANATVRSMYHMATSSVCVVDSYWPAVSLLKHKKELTIIQIWHSIGKIKKSGYQTIGKKSGRKKEYAWLLNMHAHYDYVIAGAEAWNSYYCQSFGIGEEKILNYGLPRIDYLINTEDQNRKRFFEEYPECEGKSVVLYAPTFRRNMRSHWEKILELVEKCDISLIIKNHPGQKEWELRRYKNVYYPENWKTIDLIAVCDFLITDYSAVALEAMVLRKKLYFWVYDYEQYMENNGLNIDLYKEMKCYVYKEIGELAAALNEGKYDMKLYDAYRQKYLYCEPCGSTIKIAELIEKNL